MSKLSIHHSCDDGYNWLSKEGTRANVDKKVILKEKASGKTFSKAELAS